jgi:hypothetical protein
VGLHSVTYDSARLVPQRLGPGQKPVSELDVLAAL